MPIFSGEGDAPESPGRGTSGALSLPGDQAARAPAAGEGVSRPRLLGDAWTGWDPSQGVGETLSGVSPLLHLAFHGLLTALFSAAWCVLVWIAAPRLGALGLSPAGTAGLAVLGAFGLIAPALLLCAVVLGVPLPRPLVRPLQRWTFLLWTPTSRLARSFGVSRDRLGHAFLRVANRLVLAGACRGPGEGLLVLAPRCLRPEIMRELRRLADGVGARVAVVAGGEEARAALLGRPPSGVLAIACERDLVAGIREVAARVPVLALPNQRPEGPCRNSEIDLEKAGRMLSRLAGRG